MHVSNPAIGITGTRKGMTEAQRAMLSEWLPSLYRRATWLVHGDCVGVDAEVARMWADMGGDLECHPPTVDTHRAYVSSQVYQISLDYLSRNRAIVDTSACMIAIPAEMTPQQKGGTWYTARYALKVGKPMLLVLRDGAVRKENWS